MAEYQSLSTRQAGASWEDYHFTAAAAYTPDGFHLGFFPFPEGFPSSALYLFCGQVPGTPSILLPILFFPSSGLLQSLILLIVSISFSNLDCCLISHHTCIQISPDIVGVRETCRSTSRHEKKRTSEVAANTTTA